MAVGLAAAALVVSAGSAVYQGEQQKKAQKAALKRQKKAESIARSAAGSERMAQTSEQKMQQKREPNVAAIVQSARQKRQQGETFLTGPRGSSMLGRTRSLS